MNRVNNIQDWEKMTKSNTGRANAQKLDSILLNKYKKFQNVHSSKMLSSQSSKSASSEERIRKVHGIILSSDEGKLGKTMKK